MAILDASKVDTWRGPSSYSLGHRLRRLAFSVTWLVFASWTPPPAHAWRCWLLRRFGATIAPGARIYGSVRVWYPPNLFVGPFTCIGPRVVVYSMGPITLAPYALISQGAHVCAGTHDIEDEGFQLRARPIHIGYRAWIAADAFVGPGVTVGDGAVLGARGCAMRDLDPWTVYAGNPAVAIRPRGVRFPGDGVHADATVTGTRE